jgi:hypothetical protein
MSMSPLIAIKHEQSKPVLIISLKIHTSRNRVNPPQQSYFDRLFEAVKDPY